MVACSEQWELREDSGFNSWQLTAGLALSLSIITLTISIVIMEEFIAAQLHTPLMFDLSGI